MNILIACGGTGGHLFPGLAVGEELLERRHQVLLVLSEKDVDQRSVQGARGFLLQTLPAIGWRGWQPRHAARFALMMGKAMIRTRQIFRDFRPDVAVGMGGFSSLAPLLFAWAWGLPVCIHESNAIVGRANRLVSRLVSAAAVGVKAAQAGFSGCATVCTGTPIRCALRMPSFEASDTGRVASQTASADWNAKRENERRRARGMIGLAPDKPVMLVMGGSQGAKGLNTLILETISRVTPSDIQWIHLAGVEDEARVRDAYARAGRTAQVHAFYHEMQRLYAAADLAVARAGAASLAEIAEWMLPSILIPFPHSTDGHQAANARLFAEAGAAMAWEEAGCAPEGLAAEICDILNNEKRRWNMAEATKTLRHENAHKKLADVVEGLLARKKT